MAFDIMNLFGKSARNRLLQPAQSAGGMQNFLQNPQAAVEGDPWEGLREVTVDQTQTGAVPLLPNPDQPVAEKKKSAFDNDALRDLFTGWAMGGNDWQKSLALGGTMVAQGRKDRGNRNETVEWLKGRGMDEAQAKQMAGNPTVLADYLKQMNTPQDPMKALQQQKMELEIEKLRNPTETLTDDVREYQFAKGQGFEGSFADWQIKNRQAGATNVNVGGEKGFDKTVGEGYGKRFLDMQTDAQSAQRSLNALAIMDQAMTDPNFYSGAGAEKVQQLKRIANSFGWDSAGVDSMETFNAMSKQAALDAMGGSLGTGFSNADRDFVMDQVPTLANTRDGNKRLVDIQRKLNQRRLEISDLARQYARQNEGRIDAGFDEYLAQWAADNPLFPAGKGAGASKRLKFNPATGVLE